MGICAPPDLEGSWESTWLWPYQHVQVGIETSHGQLCHPSEPGSSPSGLQIVSLRLPPASITLVLSHSVNGDVRFFDPRMPESVNVMQIVKGLTALDIHPQANLIAW